MSYTCPMHPEVQQPEPGTCPKCGMALEPAGIPRPPSCTEWVCPMHPEIVRDEPGDCPICGMALEPRTAGAEVAEENRELRDMCRGWRAMPGGYALGVDVPGVARTGSWRRPPYEGGR